MFYCVTLELHGPQDHPLRKIRRLRDVVLGPLSAGFDRAYDARTSSSQRVR